jgi:hypothetical protein
MKIKCISADIFESKSFGNCSNHGLSTRFKSVLLMHPYGHIEIDTEDLPENFCRIKEMSLGGKTYLYAEPHSKSEHLGWMSGGCLVYSSDSRFHEFSDYPLVLHDRQETQEQYDLLSH